MASASVSSRYGVACRSLSCFLGGASDGGTSLSGLEMAEVVWDASAERGKALALDDLDE